MRFCLLSPEPNLSPQLLQDLPVTDDTVGDSLFQLYLACWVKHGDTPSPITPLRASYDCILARSLGQRQWCGSKRGLPVGKLPYWWIDVVLPDGRRLRQSAKIQAGTSCDELKDSTKGL